MTPLAIAGVNLRLTLRDRTNAFFVVLFPMLMVMVLGLAFGGDYTPRVGVVTEGSGALTSALVKEIGSGDAVDVRSFDTRAAVVTAVENGELESAVVIPADYDAALSAGEPVAVEYVSRADQYAQQVGMVVRGAVDEQASRLRVAGVLSDRLDTDLSEGLELTDATAARVTEVTVETSTAGEAMFPADLGRFDIGASSQLLLFIFLTSMTSASALIETRRLGLSRRMLATPTRVSSIVAGEALGRVAVAVVQGLVIMAGSALIFGVDWGSPLGAIAVMLVFAFVGGAAGMLLGSASKTPQQAIGTGLLVGLGFAALGGSMMPLEFFSSTMLKVAHLTPHAWASEAFGTLVRHDGTIVDVATELAVLAGYAAVLFTAGAWLLRRRILRGE